MASKGVTAMIIVLAIIAGMGVLSGIGFYEELNMSVPDTANEQVQNAADNLVGQSATDRSGGSVLQDFTTSAADSLSAGWEIIANLSGVLQLLIMLPKPLADAVQLMFQFTFSLTFLFFIRGLLL